MFYCEPCREHNGWPVSLFRSAGRCEVCKVPSVCYDRPSYLLPDTKDKK